MEQRINTEHVELQLGSRNVLFRFSYLASLESDVRAFLAANGGTDFLQRVVSSSEPTLKAKRIPIHLVKPFSTEAPKHVDKKNVSVRRKLGFDIAAGGLKDAEGALQHMATVWETDLGIPTEMPLFTLGQQRLKNAPKGSEHEIMVSLNSLLPLFSKHLKGLDPLEREPLLKKHKEWLRYLSNREIKAAPTTQDVRIHFDENKEPVFIMQAQGPGVEQERRKQDRSM